jgi:hypothetical protein
MMNPLADAESKIFNWNWLYKVSGAAALILGLLFLAAMMRLVTVNLQPGAINEWLSLFPDN